MATVKLGSVVSDIRGSIGDETYGRNQGGIFVRARVDPAQPSSTARDATQAAMTALSQAWSGTLSEAQRSTWRTYAQAFTLPDRYGRPKSLGAICHFVRSNAQRYRTDSAITAELAPAQPPLPMPSFGFTAKAAGQRRHGPAYRRDLPVPRPHQSPPSLAGLHANTLPLAECSRIELVHHRHAWRIGIRLLVSRGLRHGDVPPGRDRHRQSGSQLLRCPVIGNRRATSIQLPGPAGRAPAIRLRRNPGHHRTPLLLHAVSVRRREPLERIRMGPGPVDGAPLRRPYNARQSVPPNGRSRL